MLFREVRGGLASIKSPLWLATAAAMVWPSFAAAQIEEIVVTAQKREQSLQSVPISITALTADTLKANRIQTVQDLSSVAPNLTVRLGSGGNQSPNYTLRGILGANSASGQDKGVSPYLDGVYLQAQSGSVFELADIERIEVLKGPQGTLFGRNATGGAIQIITKDPSGEFGGYQEFSVGNLGTFRSKTHVELPSWGPLSASFTYLHSQHDGDVKNLGAGTQWNYVNSGTVSGIRTSPKRLGDSDVDAFMGALKLEFDKLDVIYKFDYSEDDYTPNAQGVGFLSAALAPFYAGVPNPTPVTTKRPDALNNWFTTPGKTVNYGHNLTMKYRFNDIVSIKNILAFRSSRNQVTFQLDGLGGISLGGFPFIILANNAYQREYQWSDEFQVNVSTSWMTLTTGFLHFYDHIKSAGFDNGFNTTAFVPVIGQNTVLFGTPFAIPANVGYTGVQMQTFSDAIYAQPEFHLTKKLDFVAGIRVTIDEKDGHETCPNQAVPCLPSGALVSSIKYKHSQLTYLAGLNYKITDEVLAYVKYATGFVSGGSLSTLSFSPEKARSWEVGLKADLLNRRWRSNLAVFNVKYDAIQYNTSGLLTGVPSSALFAQAVVNQGNAKAIGFEWENTINPVTGLTFTANVGYTNFQFQQSTIPAPLAAVAGPAGFQPFQRPKWTGTLAAQYDSPEVFRGGHWTARIDANFKSESLLTSNIVSAASFPNADPAVVASATAPFQWILNARLGLVDVDLGPTRAEIALWGRNLLNNRDIVQYTGVPFFGLGPDVGSVIYERARTYGVDLRFNF